MQSPRIGRERQQRFLAALAAAGSEETAANEAGVDRARLFDLRENDREFSIQWDKANRSFGEKLEQEVRRRAIIGVREPLVSDGKVVRDDEGRPIAVPRFSDGLLLALLKARCPESFNEPAADVTKVYPLWIRWVAILFLGAVLVWIIGDLAIRASALH